MSEKFDVVFDTGVVLQAGLRTTGPAARLVSLIDQDRFTLYVNEEALAEYEEVLHRRSIRAKNPHLSDQLATAIVQRIRDHATLVTETPRHFQYPRDPDDESILNLAIAKAQYLVSRDKDLLDLMDENRAEGHDFRQRFPHLIILDPVTFLHILFPAPEQNSALS